MTELRDVPFVEVERWVSDGYRIVCGAPTAAGWTVMLEAPRREVLPVNDNVVVDRILTVVSKYYGLIVADILGRDKHSALRRPRQVSAYLARELTGLSFPEIGQRMSRDHTTIMEWFRHISDSLESPKLQAELEDIKKQLAV
jgi:chromosomal replication initiator protein